VRAHGGVARRLRVGACLSLSGRFSRFGRRAARALEVWASLDGAVDLLIEDDASDVRRLQAVLPGVAARSDLLLGPYSTLLMRAAGNMAADAGWLMWNHGGSGDDVETAHPGHVVSVPTPASRYAEPFLRHLTAITPELPELRITHGTGRFGRQVASGAEAYARELGFSHLSAGPADAVISGELAVDWVLVTAGTFEEDIRTVTRARSLAQPPCLTCAVAAGVQEFGETVKDADGTFGIGQWFPRSGQPLRLGPSEGQFLDAYRAAAGEPPDYPAAQAIAGAVLAVHCARQAGATDREVLWPVAAALDTSTLFGAFKIDQASGAQIAHRTVLVRWVGKERTAVRPAD
jgi:ABC-type branched-subunit amino acid transport system substrate-binding protein